MEEEQIYREKLNILKTLGHNTDPIPGGDGESLEGIKSTYNLILDKEKAINELKDAKHIAIYIIVTLIFFAERVIGAPIKISALIFKNFDNVVSVDDVNRVLIECCKLLVDPLLLTNATNKENLTLVLQLYNVCIDESSKFKEKIAKFHSIINPITERVSQQLKNELNNS